MGRALVIRRGGGGVATGATKRGANGPKPRPRSRRKREKGEGEGEGAVEGAAPWLGEEHGTKNGPARHPTPRDILRLSLIGRCLSTEPGPRSLNSSLLTLTGLGRAGPMFAIIFSIG